MRKRSRRSEPGIAGEAENPDDRRLVSEIDRQGVPAEPCGGASDSAGRRACSPKRFRRSIPEADPRADQGETNPRKKRIVVGHRKGVGLREPEKRTDRMGRDQKGGTRRKQESCAEKQGEAGPDGQSRQRPDKGDAVQDAEVDRPLSKQGISRYGEAERNKQEPAENSRLGSRGESPIRPTRAAQTHGEEKRRTDEHGHPPPECLGNTERTSDRLLAVGLKIKENVIRDHDQHRDPADPIDPDLSHITLSDRLATPLEPTSGRRHGNDGREVARRLNMRSLNGYAKYEKGEISMSVDQFERMLHVIDPQAKVFLKIG